MEKVTYRTNSIPRPIPKNDFLDSLLNSMFTKMVLLGVSVFLIYNVTHSIRITLQKIDILHNAREEVEALRLKNLELATSLSNMESVEFLEVEARDRLNYSEDRDIVFVIPDELMSSARDRIESILNDEVVVDSKDVLEQWRNLIINGV